MTTASGLQLLKFHEGFGSMPMDLSQMSGMLFVEFTFQMTFEKKEKEILERENYERRAIVVKQSNSTPTFNVNLCVNLPCDDWSVSQIIIFPFNVSSITPWTPQNSKPTSFQIYDKENHVSKKKRK